MIEAGRVCVNGKIAQLGERADPEIDRIEVDGKLIAHQPALCYLMLNKPRGYVTSMHDEKGRRDVSELVADCGTRVFPVGRLDMDSEGLLLFTNDGALANALMHPRGEVNKCYLVTVIGFRPEAVQILRQPLVIDGYRIKPAQVKLELQEQDRAQLRITIHEGRNRQIRKMCAQAGLTVKNLRRVEESGLKLGDLKPGCWRFLTPKELEQLRLESHCE